MQSSFKETVEEIVARHHSLLRKDLPTITQLLDALSIDCPGSQSLGEAQQLYKKVRTKIETHLKDEETVLFPTGISLESGGTAPPSEMDILERLKEMEKGARWLRQCTHNYLRHDQCGQPERAARSTFEHDSTGARRSPHPCR